MEKKLEKFDLSKVSMFDKRAAAVAACVDASQKTAEKVFTALGVNYEAYSAFVGDVYNKCAKETDVDKARRAVATALNAILADNAKVSLVSWAVTDLTGGLRRWSTAHRQHEFSSSNFMREFSRTVYEQLVGAFECPKEYDAAREATKEYNKTRVFLDGRKNKEGEYTALPAELKLSKLRTELAVLNGINAPELSDRIDDMKERITDLEKRIETAKSNIVMLKVKSENAGNAYKTAIKAHTDSLSAKIQGDDATKILSRVAMAKTIAENLASREKVQPAKAKAETAANAEA